MVTFIEIAGFGLVCAAAFMMSIPAGLAVLGMCLLVLGVALDRR
jgi:hypothetical protein